MSGLKHIIVPFMFGGVALGMLLEPYKNGKQPMSTTGMAGILAATLLLFVWNAFMYRKAGKQTNPAFPTSAFERYLPPVVASASFVVGAGILLVQ